MTSTSNTPPENVGTEMKTEIITIDDEIQLINGFDIDEIHLPVESSEAPQQTQTISNGGICYFFEPQTSKSATNNKKSEQKSE